MRTVGGCLLVIGLLLTATVFGAFLGVPLLLVGWMLHMREDEP
jgi:hypothetical protein